MAPALTAERHRPLRVGLTGGIASGKSTVAALLAARGAPVIDTDRLAREAVAPGTEGLAAVAEAFGPQILAADGSLDRAALGRRVFADPEARQRLEAILHPRIHARLEARLERIRAPYAVAMVPLLIETGWHRDMDAVVIVDLPEAEQRERLMARDGLSAEDAEARRSAQASRAQRLEAAHYTIDNSGARAALAGQVGGVHLSLVERARRTARAEQEDP